jgi:hypothetical protein
MASLLLELVVELFLQVGLEALWELGSAAYKAAYRRPARSVPLAAAGYFVVGAALGGVSLLIWPTRLLEPRPIPGSSLLLSPLGAGLVMQAWGERRRARGVVTTRLATFPGGAAFAFGTALVRLLWAR